MKTRVSKFASTILVLIYCSLQCNFIQTDTTQVLSTYGKGIVFLKADRLIKNVRLRQIKDLFIVYEKDGNLHDLMKDEINRIEFINAKPKPIFMQFEKSNVVIYEMQQNIH